MEEEQPTQAAVANGDPLIGRVLEGRYRITRRIATGGMGRIYLAEQRGLERVVAVKVLSVLGEAERRGPADSDAQWRDRFFREAKLCSRLSHPNTVRIYDYGKTDDDVYFIAMEYVEGRTLTTVLRDDGALDPLRAVNLTLQICASLAEAHGLGLIHRDLKPDNLMITRHADEREFVKVLDFGIAKDLENTAELPTEAGVVYGSPGYMSPEQILEEPLTPRSDLYSLGAILFKMLTASGLFGSANPVAALTRHVTTQPLSFRAANPNVAVPATLEWVTLACLAKAPADRFASMVELGRALRVCDLELRGMLVPGPVSLTDGQLVLAPAVEEQLRRFEGERTPAPARPRRDAAVDPPSQPTRPTSSITGPALLVIGGLVPLGAVAGVVLVALLVVLWVAFALPSDEPLPEASAAVPLPPIAGAPSAAPVAPVGTAESPESPESAAEDAASEEPEEPTPSPRSRARRTGSAPTPEPTVAPAPAPPAPVPPPATDPTRRDDLRNPFED